MSFYTNVIRTSPKFTATTRLSDLLKGLAEANGLIWGGDWGDGSTVHSFVDDDHVQRINVAEQAKRFNSSWYPADAYRPILGQ